MLSVFLEGRACRKGKKVTVGKASNGGQIVGTFKARLKRGLYSSGNRRFLMVLERGGDGS